MISTTKLWLLIHVAMAKTARGTKAVKSTTTANCSLMPIRILKTPSRKQIPVAVQQYALLLDACVDNRSPPFPQPPRLAVPCSMWGSKTATEIGPCSVLLCSVPKTRSRVVRRGVRKGFGEAFADVDSTIGYCLRSTNRGLKAVVRSSAPQRGSLVGG